MTLNRPLIFAAGAFVAITASACSGQDPLHRASEAPVPVRTTTVRMSDIADTFEAGGVVQARTTATLTARILAPVREVRVKPGDRVRAGEVVVVLDGSDLRAHSRSARAAAAAADQAIAGAAGDRQAAEAGLTLARAAHTRIASLHAKRSATAQELDEATAALRRAEAAGASAIARAQGAASALEGARAAADAAEATASFATITAPFAGVIAEKLVEPGNMAAPGTPLIRLEDTGAFRLELRVDESRAADISTGTTVKVTLDSGASLDARVSEMARAVDADTRAFSVKIDLPNTDGIRSGQFGRASFAAKARRGLVVPAAALTHRGQVTSVLVVDNGTARLRLVNARGTEILAGLVEGDVVIVEPPPGLTDGRRVSTGGRP